METFTSAKEFLERSEHDGPQCVVLDVRMLGQGGIELHEHLVASGRDMPVIFITGHADVPTAVRAMKAGAVDFLSKPVDDVELLGPPASLSSATAAAGRPSAPCATAAPDGVKHVRNAPPARALSATPDAGSRASRLRAGRHRLATGAICAGGAKAVPAAATMSMNPRHSSSRAATNLS